MNASEWKALVAAGNVPERPVFDVGDGSFVEPIAKVLDDGRLSLFGNCPAKRVPDFIRWLQETYPATEGG